MTHADSKGPETFFPPFGEEIYNPRSELVAVRYDVNRMLEHSLGADWSDGIQDLVARSGRQVVHDASHDTCREEDPDKAFSMVILGGKALVDRYPGFWNLYTGAFRELMRSALPPSVTDMTTYDDPEMCMEVMKQIPSEPDQDTQNRLEAHVDQRYSAILAVVVPKRAGRLVVSNDPNASSVEEINRDAMYVSHKPGTLLCFSMGRELPHYTEPIDIGENRIVIGANYPVADETPAEAEEMSKYIRGL